MEKEQEDRKFLGFFGILKESFKIIWSWREIFRQITLSLILPLSFIFLAEIHISLILFDKNHHKYASSKSIGFWLFQVAAFIFLTIFTLLSTVAVVYTISCKFTAKEISFKKLPSVLSKVWKRSLVTFLWSFFIVFVYNFVAGIIIELCDAFIGSSVGKIVILVVLVILYLIGFVYLGIVCLLANVVSVLEDVSGIKALRKSKALIKGKMGIAVAIFVLLGIIFFGIGGAYEHLVVLGNLDLGVGIRIGVGILCFLFLFNVILFGLVSQTVLYFVCKSHHHENIGTPLDPPIIQLGGSRV